MTLAKMFHRKETTAWTDVEICQFKKLCPINPGDLAALAEYYAAHWPPERDKNVLRHDLKTLLNNFPGEVDRANTWKLKGTTSAAAPATPYGPVQPNKWQLPDYDNDPEYAREPA